MTKPPRWLIPFDWEEVEVWDKVNRYIIHNRGTKREKAMYYDCYHVYDVDIFNKQAITESNIIRSFNDNLHNIYKIDRRSNLQRLTDWIRSLFN